MFLFIISFLYMLELSVYKSHFIFNESKAQRNHLIQITLHISNKSGFLKQVFLIQIYLLFIMIKVCRHRGSFFPLLFQPPHLSITFFPQK